MFKIFPQLILFLIISFNLYATEPESISKDEVLKVAEITKQKIESIAGYQFILVKRELVDGKDTGYQYLNVKVRTEPLSIYVKFLKPEKLAGREALYYNDELVVKRGGNRMSSMVLYITPDSPLAMDGNRYPITYINPKVLANELITKIEKELKFPETKLEIYRQAKIDGKSGTLYRMIHTEKKEGMECCVAEIIISKESELPIYFRVRNFHNIILEEYAFRNMIINPVFSSNEFDQDKLSKKNE